MTSALGRVRWLGILAAGLILATRPAAVCAQPSGPSPITAAPIALTETSAAWGIDFEHHAGVTGRYYMVETNGGGVVVFDYDDDGDDDLFVNGQNRSWL